MKLLEVDFNEFEKLIYKEYLNLFEEQERKPYEVLKKCFEKGVMKIFKITLDNIFVGFAIINLNDNMRFVQLDFFAILPKYQNKGYGTKAIKLIKEYIGNNKYILIEIETLGLGKDEKENLLREKREVFYKRLGFVRLNFNLELFKVVYTPYILGDEVLKDDTKTIIKEIFELYYFVVEKKRIDENCKVLYLK